jgi:hypothetical protein
MSAGLAQATIRVVMGNPLSVVMNEAMFRDVSTAVITRSDERSEKTLD